MPRPNNPKHKSIIVVDDYATRDGKYANNTDAVSLSIGLAQWDNDENEISGKVFRRKNGTWIRSSEELPLHRILDLSILTISSFIISDTNNESNKASESLNEEIINQDNIHFIQEQLISDNVNLLPRIKELGRLIELFNNQE